MVEQRKKNDMENFSVFVWRKGRDDKYAYVNLPLFNFDKLYVQNIKVTEFFGDRFSAFCPPLDWLFGFKKKFSIFNFNYKSATLFSFLFPVFRIL